MSKKKVFEWLASKMLDLIEDKQHPMVLSVYKYKKTKDDTKPEYSEILEPSILSVSEVSSILYEYRHCCEARLECGDITVCAQGGTFYRLNYLTWEAEDREVQNSPLEFLNIWMEKSIEKISNKSIRDELQNERLGFSKKERCAERITY